MHEVCVLKAVSVLFFLMELSMPEGTVKWFNPDKGFGFIEREDGEKDLFVHKSETQEILNEGDKVEFEIGEGKKGPCATSVKKI